ncbi:hypothetical protein PENTCL1PPCAC_27843, partial [Pristionchus entomophagus]
PLFSEMKKEESEEDDDEDNEEEEEEKKGLLEMSPVVEGKRKRESTSFFTKVTPAKPKPKTPTMAGSGTALEDIPFIMHQIDGVKKVEDLRPLHHICYGSPGTPVKTVLRKELKKFNGFSFAKDSDAFKKRLLLINKYTKPELAHGLEIYKDNNKPTKDAEVQRIMDFLANPHDEVKSLPKKAIKRMKGKTPAKRAKNESDSGEMENDEKEEDKEEEDEEEEKDNDEEEEEEKEEAPKETPKKAAPKKGKAAEKKTKSQLTPSDKEVKAKIAELLGTMDLKKVTMKQSVAAVVAAFPAHRRELLKRTSSIEGFINTKLEELKGN